ncbi:MAG: YigZ family protein [Eubacteriales bacterium]|nr:YigZ family protein [Eubacteriales bacterium]
MEQTPDAYRTLSAQGVWEFTEKKSRFIGYAASALTQEQALAYIGQVKAAHTDCSAVLYGYISGYYANVHRFFDAHEPQGGLQILEALKRREVTGAVAAVVRYYGGVQLGAGPLGRAFGKAAAQAIELARPALVEKSLRMRVSLPYEASGRLDYLFEHAPYRLEKMEYGQDITAVVFVRGADKARFADDMAALTGGKARPELLEEAYSAWEKD